MIPALETPLFSRRRLLQAGLVGGAAAWVGGTAWSRMQGADRPRLAVFAMQGGLDGLSLAPPLKDARYLALRRELAITEPLPFNGDFGLHPAMPELARMARAGQVRLAPAAASPTRSRSHFAEMDVLTTGIAATGEGSTGWLNRAVTALAPGGALPAVSLDTVASAATAGPTPFGAWTPGVPALDGFAQHLQALYKDDDRLRSVAELAVLTERRARAAADGVAGPMLAMQARALGGLFAQDDGPVAGFVTGGGFDTHQHQGAERGQLADRLRELDQALAALREGAGPAWAHTVAIVFTEFGRTAAVNGSGGTDHGIGGAALVVGGAVRAGGLVGDWPGLKRLYEGRDVAPGADLHALFKGVLADHWGLDRTQLGRAFPSSAARPLTGLVA